MAVAKYIFSYAREDSAFVLELAQQLRAYGVDLWLDQLDILPGQRWDRAVESALASCGGMIAVLSPHSVASNNVMDEVSYALQEEKHLVPILLQPCDVPFRLRRVQHVDFTVGYDAGFARLLKALDVGRSVAPGPAPGTPEGALAGRDETSSPSSQPVATPPPPLTVPPNAGNPWLRRLQHAAVGGIAGALWGLLVTFLVLGAGSWQREGPGLTAFEAILGLVAGGLLGTGSLRFALAGAVLGSGFTLWLSIGDTHKSLVDALGDAAIGGLPAGVILGAIVGLVVHRLRLRSNAGRLR